MDAGLGCLIENLGERRFRCLSAEESGFVSLENNLLQAADWNGDDGDLIVVRRPVLLVSSGDVGRRDTVAAPEHLQGHRSLHG